MECFRYKLLRTDLNALVHPRSRWHRKASLDIDGYLEPRLLEIHARFIYKSKLEEKRCSPQ
jgi:hypothetical protein